MEQSLTLLEIPPIPGIVLIFRSGDAFSSQQKGIN